MIAAFVRRAFGHRGVIRGVALIAAVALVNASAFAADTPITIWNLGDSVTDGAGSPKTGEPDSGGLRKSMINQLLADGFNPTLYGSVNTEHPDRIPKVMDTPTRRFHEGHNGFTIGGVMGGVESWLGKSPSNHDQPIYPDYITVMIGTNDTGKAYFKAKDAGTPEDEKEVIGAMSKEVHTLIEKITTLRPDAHVIVSSIIPTYWAYGIESKITGHPFPGDGAPKDKTDYLN
ncbi:MAG: cellulose-binding family, partial [Phycisphaerales bacterium]|nr:cellulose-binding family [Phycisphaerales bacterium]